MLDKHKGKINKLSLLTGIGVMLVAVGVGENSIAYALPDAGSIAAGVNQDRGWKPNGDEPEVNVDLGEINPAENNIKIKINSFEIDIDTDKVDKNELAKVIAGDVKDEASFSDLQQTAAKLTAYLHQHGYMTAIAYLPTQEIVDGVVKIEVMIGHYGETSYDNTSELCTSRADGFTHPSRTGKLIRRQPMDKLLLIMNDIPGVKAHAFLSPGKQDGRADVRYQLTTTETDGGYMYVDNYGSRYTGRWRIGGGYYWNNLSHVGDQVQIGYLQSFGNNIQNYDVRYQLPVGNFGTFAGIEFYRTDYQLGLEYTPQDIRGTSHGVRLFTRSSMKRTLNNNWYFLTELSKTNLSDRINILETDSQKHNLAFRFGFDGDNRNSHSASTYKLMHSVGHLTLNSQYAQEYNYYGTEGTWQKTTLDVYHIEKLNNCFELHTSMSAQYPWTNLDSSEKIYIGGYNAVRAFPQGETGGDMGVYGTAELRYQTGNPHWQVAAFYDAGWTEYNHRALDDGAENTRTLQGAGVGIIWNDNGRSFGRLDFSYPIGKRYSNSYGEKIGGTVWFRFIHRI